MRIKRRVCSRNGATSLLDGGCHWSSLLCKLLLFSLQLMLVALWLARTRPCTTRLPALSDCLNGDRPFRATRDKIHTELPGRVPLFSDQLPPSPDKINHDLALSRRCGSLSGVMVYPELTVDPMPEVSSATPRSLVNTDLVQSMRYRKVEKTILYCVR